MRQGMGSVEKLGAGRWRIWVELARDPSTGKRRRRTKTVRGTRQDAERERAKMLAEAGTAPRNPVTLREFWNTWYLPRCRERLRPDTVYGYENEFSRFLDGSIADMKVEDISPAVVDAWLSSIDGEGRRFSAYRLLRQVLNRAVRMDMADYNPCDRIEPPRKQVRYEPEVLDATTAARYLEVFHGDPLEPVVLVALGCGLRRSEIAALRWSDIHDGVVDVDDGVVSVGGKPTRGDTKTLFSKRSVHVPPPVMERLDELRGKPDAPVAADSDGNPLHPDTISRRYKKRLDAELRDGERYVPLKNLRHTSLTLALESGASLLAVSRRAGHSGVGITSRFYIRPHEDVDRQTAEGLGGILGSGIVTGGGE